METQRVSITYICHVTLHGGSHQFTISNRLPGSSGEKDSVASVAYSMVQKKTRWFLKGRSERSHTGLSGEQW